MLTFLYALAVGAAPTPPSPKAGPRPAEVRTAPRLPADVRAKVAACNANILIDTTATIKVKDQSRKTRVLLCSTPGQNSSQKSATLRNAIVSINANPQLAADEKARIVALMNVKLVELSKQM